MRKELLEEIREVLDGLHQGIPLGKVIAALSEINDRAILTSYVTHRKSTRECGRLHGVPFHYVHKLVQKYAPSHMRPKGWTRGRASPTKGQANPKQSERMRQRWADERAKAIGVS